MKTFALFCFLLFILSICNSQNTFQKSFEGYSGYAVEALPDSGVMVVGYNFDELTLNPQVVLLKLNKEGDTVWTKLLELNTPAYVCAGFSIKRLNGNGFVICGMLMDQLSSIADVCLLRTDDLGNLVWTKAYTDTLLTSSSDPTASVAIMADGGFIVGRSGYASGTSVFKTDSAGNILWSNYFGELDHLVGGEFVQEVPGGYIVTGNYTVAGSGPPYANIELLKLDDTGNLVWTRTWGTANFEYGTSSVLTDDSCYLTCGYGLVSGYSWAFLFKTDSMGNSIWSKNYSVGNLDLFPCSITKDNGGFVLCGENENLAGFTDIFLLRLQNDGTISWIKSIGGPGNEFGKSALQMRDGGYVITGSDEYKGIAVIKTNGSGNSGCNEFTTSCNVFTNSIQMPVDSFSTHNSLSAYTPTIKVKSGCSDTTLCENIITHIPEKVESGNSFQVYPNPLNDQSVLAISLVRDESIRIEIFDITGKMLVEVVQTHLNSGDYQFPLTGIDTKGVYILELRIGNAQVRRKLIRH